MIASRNGDSDMVQLLLCNAADPKQTADKVKLGSQKRQVCMAADLYTLFCVTESRRDTPCAPFVANPSAAGCTIHACSCAALLCTHAVNLHKYCNLAVWCSGLVKTPLSTSA